MGFPFCNEAREGAIELSLASDLEIYPHFLWMDAKGPNVRVVRFDDFKNNESLVGPSNNGVVSGMW